MSDGGALIEPSSPFWAEVLDRTRHDIYHLPGYIVADAARGAAVPMAFHWRNDRGDSLLLPLLLRRLRGTEYVDATSSYGYPGPLVVGDGFARQDWLEACAALVETLGENRAVACFVRLHPLFPVSLDMLSSVGSVVYHGDTVNIDLRLSHEQLWAQLRSHYRRDIRRGSEQGLRVVVDDRWEHLDEFMSLYHETMRRVDAAPFYFFDRDYFQHLRDLVGDHVHLVLAMVDDVVASGGLFFEAGGIVEYHLGGTRTEYLPQSPFKAILQFVTKWAKDRGNMDFHIGGGFGAESGTLLRFKLGFSHDVRPFHTWRIVIQEERYRSLCARFNPTADPDDLTGFFPLYRDGPAGDPGPSLDQAAHRN